MACKTRDIKGIPDNASQWNLGPHTEPFYDGNSDGYTASEVVKEDTKDEQLQSKYMVCKTFFLKLNLLGDVHTSLLRRRGGERCVTTLRTAA